MFCFVLSPKEPRGSINIEYLLFQLNDFCCFRFPATTKPLPDSSQQPKHPNFYPQSSPLWQRGRNPTFIPVTNAKAFWELCPLSPAEDRRLLPDVLLAFAVPRGCPPERGGDVFHHQTVHAAQVRGHHAGGHVQRQALHPHGRRGQVLHRQGWHLLRVCNHRQGELPKFLLKTCFESYF